MKIIQLIPNLAGGGAERFVVDLSNELAKTHEVVLITLYDTKSSDIFLDHLVDKVQIITLGKKLGFDWRVIGKLRKAIKHIKPDIIHTHLRVLNYLMPSIHFLGNVKIVHTIHSDAHRECRNTKIRKVRKYFFKKRIITPVTISKTSAKSFEKAYGLSMYKLIYNGRNKPKKSNQFNTVSKEIEGYKNDLNTKIFITIGRIEKVKNQLLLVEAFKQFLNNDNVNAILLIIGGGRNNKNSLAIQEKLIEMKNDKIFLLGEKNNATDYLYASDYFCLSSLFEGMPITLIEAFATGTIPISTSVGGITEMISELDDSLLSEDLTINSYYNTLKQAYFLSDKKKGTIEKHAVELFSNKYSIKNCSLKYVKLYNKLIKNSVKTL